MRNETQEVDKKSEFPKKKYPLCTNCSSELYIKRKNKKIELYCNNCSFSYLLSIDDQVIKSLFEKNNFKMTESLKNIQCNKCMKQYCPYCFFSHKDIITSACIDDKIYIHDKKILIKVYLIKQKLLQIII